MQQNTYAAKRGTEPRKVKKRIVLAAVLLLAAAAVAAVIVRLTDADRSAYYKSRDVFLDNISVCGVDIGGMMYNDAFTAVMQAAENAHNTWQLDIACNGFTYTTATYHTVGLLTDFAAIEQLLVDAWQYGHGTFEEYKRDVAKLAEMPFAGTPDKKDGSYAQLDYVLDVIAENVYRAPQDASLLSFDAENPQQPFLIQPHMAGQGIDKNAAREEILRRAYSGEGGMYDIPLMQIAPSVTQESVEKSITLLAVGRNAIDKSSTSQRNENIRLAFEKFNGMILEHGKSFSFNNIVGARTVKNGFLPAMGYVSGELTEVIGGGVCQASTTLYSAALGAGLTIEERTPHSMPVSYIELGQDAAVNYVRGHMIDLKFKNETGAPLYITASIEENESGRLMSVVRIFGQAHEADVHYRLRSVEIERLPLPKEEVVRRDRDAKYVKYTDQSYLYSKGSEGYVVETYLQKMAGTTVLEEKLISTDTYNARPVIRYVGVTKRE